MQNLIFLTEKEVELLDAVRKRRIHNGLDKAAFVLNSAILSGAKAEEKDVKGILSGHVPHNMKIREIELIKNSGDAFDLAMGRREDITEEFIRKLHLRMLHGIHAGAGQYRQENTEIYGSSFMPSDYLVIEEEMEQLCEWCSQNNSSCHPLELAAVFHVRLVSIYPFSDGNGRMARLLFNAILHRHSWPILVFPAKDKKRYTSSLEKSHMEGTEEPFFEYVLEEYVNIH